MVGGTSMRSNLESLKSHEKKFPYHSYFILLESVLCVLLEMFKQMINKDIRENNLSRKEEGLTIFHCLI